MRPSIAQAKNNCLTTVNRAARILRILKHHDVGKHKLAESAASLWERTRRYGLSLAERTCLALAIERGVIVLTADRAWGKLDLSIDIHIVRRGEATVRV